MLKTSEGIMADGGRRRIEAVADWVFALGVPIIIVLAILPLILPRVNGRHAPEIDAGDLGFSTMPAARAVGYDQFVLFPTNRAQEASLKCNGYRQVEISPDLFGWLVLTEGNGAIPPGWQFVEDDVGFDCAEEWRAVIKRLDQEEAVPRE